MVMAFLMRKRVCVCWFSCVCLFTCPGGVESCQNLEKISTSSNCWVFFDERSVLFLSLHSHLNLLCPSFTYRFFTFSASSFPSFLATRASRWGCRCGRKGQSAVTENLSGCHAHFHPFQTIPVTIWYTFADCCCCLWSLTHAKKSRY